VRAAFAVALLVGPAALTLTACVSTQDSAPRAPFPEIDAATPVAVLPFRNDTGNPLPLRSGNPLRELGAATGDPYGAPASTVPEALTSLVHDELARRGVPVLPLSIAARAIPKPPPDAAAAVEAARGAGLTGPVLFSRLQRFTVSSQGFLVAWLDLELRDAATGASLWTSRVRRTVPVRSALTLQEVVLDAAPTLLADALGRP
jgi:hypothetical protein